MMVNIKKFHGFRISSKCRENFCVFASSVWKVLKKTNAQLRIDGKTFAIDQKFVKTAKLFSATF